MKRGWINAGVIAAFVFAGCPEESSPADEDGGDDEIEAGSEPERDAGTGKSDAGTGSTSSDPAAKVGTFTVQLVAPTTASGQTPATPGQTKISGKVFAGPVPEEVAWDLQMESGGCRLMKPRVPFCDPACGRDVCVDDDKCQPNPSALNVGLVTFNGFKSSGGGAADVKVEPIAASYSTPAGVSLSYPSFDEGAEVGLSAAGAGSVSSFEIKSKGIAPLELTTTTFPLKSDSALAIAWKAPGKSDISRIQIKLNISHHGGTKGEILCDVPDNGSLSIAADLIGRLLSLGVAGFPTIVVDRVASGSAQIAAGKVELRIVSELEKSVQIDGLTSCNDHSDCAAGKMCQADLTCSK